MSPDNCVLTLTFRPEIDPMVLCIETMQLFIKRLRKRVSTRISYLLSGEYMESGSPHYHVCIFGFDFPDKYFWKISPSGDRLHRSVLLESVWADPDTSLTYGHALIGTLDFRSAAYVAGYTLKKVFAARRHPVQSEFRLSSSCPALGLRWFEQNFRETLRDEVATPSGSTVPLPRYYLDQLERISPHDADQIRRARASAAADSIDEAYISRLPSRERFALSKFSKRGLA